MKLPPHLSERFVRECYIEEAEGGDGILHLHVFQLILLTTVILSIICSHPRNGVTHLFWSLLDRMVFNPEI